MPDGAMGVRLDIEQITKEMEARTWFHRYEIAPGIWSPGRLNVNASAALNQHGVPNDLTGKKVIDIGALDGAYSFEFARRGASVLAIDLQNPDRTGFSLARRLKNADVEYRVMSVYDAIPETVGRFDYVWYWGVFYHLRDPLIAFRNIWKILDENGTLFFEGAVLDYGWNVDPSLLESQKAIEDSRHLPITYFSKGPYARDGSNWFIPNMTCLRDWLSASGFKDIKAEVNTRASRGVGRALRDNAFTDFEYGRY